MVPAFAGSIPVVRPIRLYLLIPFQGKRLNILLNLKPPFQSYLGRLVGQHQLMEFIDYHSDKEITGALDLNHHE